MNSSPYFKASFLSIVRHLYPKSFNTSFSKLNLSEKREIFRNVIRYDLLQLHINNNHVDHHIDNHIENHINNHVENHINNHVQLDSFQGKYNNNSIHKSSIIYPNRQEKILLIKYLGISASELNELFIDARKWNERQSKYLEIKRIKNEKVEEMNILETNLLKNHTTDTINIIHTINPTNNNDSIANYIQIDKNKLWNRIQSNNISRRATRSNKIPFEQKVKIYQLLESRNFNKLNQEDIQLIQKSTGLSKSQIYNQISQLKDKYFSNSQDLIQYHFNTETKSQYNTNLNIENNIIESSLLNVLSTNNDKIHSNSLNSSTSSNLLYPFNENENVENIETDGLVQDKESNTLLKTIIQYINERKIDLKSKKLKFSSQYLLELRQNTGISKMKLKGVIRNIRFALEKGKVTHEKKELIYKWINNHQIYEVPPLSQLNQISENVGLSRLQIQGIISRKLDKKSQISNEVKEILKEFIQNKISSENKNSNRIQSLSLTSSEIDFLHQKTGLSRQQIHNQLRTLSNINSISKDKKEIVLNWLRENNFKKPNAQDILFLAEHTQLSKYQIYYILWKIKDKPGEITFEKKIKIKEYVTKYNNELPTEILSKLQKETQLSRQQLHKQISVIKDPPGKITIESKKIIEDLCKIHGYNLNNDYMKLLQESTFLSRDQIRRILKTIEKKNKSI